MPRVEATTKDIWSEKSIHLRMLQVVKRHMVPF